MKGNQSKLAAETFLEEDLLLDNHLQVHCGMYGGVSKCYVEVHSTIKLETLAGVHYIIATLSDCMKLRLQSHATDATFLKRSHLMMVICSSLAISRIAISLAPSISPPPWLQHTAPCSLMYLALQDHRAIQDEALLGVVQRVWLSLSLIVPSICHMECLLKLSHKV